MIIAKFRQTRHLIRAGLTIARYDVSPPAQLAAAPLPARLLYGMAKWVAGKPAKVEGSALNAALVELGPSYIKLGQFLATRPDFVGKERAVELAMLQDRLQPFSHDLAMAEIGKGLGESADKWFSRFDDPIAAASIAQVHKAHTSDPDMEVAVKILRPGVEKRFQADLDSFYLAAHTLERLIPDMARLRPVEAVNILARSVTLEMDLRMEASAMAEMAENSKDDEGFRVPKIDWQRTTSRILTSEWIDGIPLNDTEKLVKAGIDLTKMADQIVQTFLRHAIRDGFFHADMHQGNLFADKKGNLVAVDFGIMGRLAPKERLFLAEILYGFIKRDYLRVSQVHLDAGYVPAHHDVHVFAQALRAIGEPIMDRRAEDISMGRLLGQLLEVTGQFDMKTQPQLILLQKTMVVVEGVARSLNPQFNMWQCAEPVVREWIEKRLGPQGRLENVSDSAMAMARLATDFPQLATTARTALEQIASQAENSNNDHMQKRSGNIALWTGAIALVVIALAQIF